MRSGIAAASDSNRSAMWKVPAVTIVAGLPVALPVERVAVKSLAPPGDRSQDRTRTCFILARPGVRSAHELLRRRILEDRERGARSGRGDRARWHRDPRRRP